MIIEGIIQFIFYIGIWELAKYIIKKVTKQIKKAKQK